MKYVLYLILISFFGANYSCSDGLINDTESFIDFCGDGNNKEYINFEFGFSKITSVYINKNDTHLDVYITDGNMVSFSTMCEIPPIINWAFEKMPNESASVRLVMNDEYEPLF